MNQHSFFVLLGICITLTAGVAFADEQSMAHAVAATNAIEIVLPSLTPEESVQNALANNRELAVARARVEEAQARLVQAGDPLFALDARTVHAELAVRLAAEEVAEVQLAESLSGLGIATKGERGDLRIFVGQQMDVFIDASTPDPEEGAPPGRKQ